MRDPVDHVLRPNLPWRREIGATECGLDGSKVPTLTRDEFLARLKDYGSQRTALTTCMTCCTVAGNWKTWDDDPVSALGREIRSRAYGRLGDLEEIRLELLAIAELVAAHREEFDELLKRMEWAQRKERRR